MNKNNKKIQKIQKTGVATVVTKLFNIIEPNRVYFGQKDFVQTIAIETLIRDLNMPIEMKVCPTLREKDGLAMSSRNSYLSTEERIDATIIYKALYSANEKYLEDKNSLKKLKISQLTEHVKDIVSTKSSLIDYVIVSDMFDASEFSPHEDVPYDRRICISLACKIGKTRLIDNFVLDPFITAL